MSVCLISMESISGGLCAASNAILTMHPNRDNESARSTHISDLDSIRRVLVKRQEMLSLPLAAKVVVYPSGAEASRACERSDRNSLAFLSWYLVFGTCWSRALRGHICLAQAAVHNEVGGVDKAALVAG
jgi:hypothetical protein